MDVERRFIQDRGQNIFNGCELLVKGALETERGVQLLTGYPGSPIAGFFDCLGDIRELLAARGIEASMANNEALSVAMVNGSQMAPIRAMTVMKSVGVHVASDGLALGNLAGPHPEGGVVVVYGDDPWNESTQVPADSRYISQHLRIPVVEPSNIQETKDWVNLSFDLSRRSGLYIGYIVTTLLADGGGTVECFPNHYSGLNRHHPTGLDTERLDLENTLLLPPRTGRREADLADRFERLLETARGLEMSRIMGRPNNDRARLGIVSTGVAYQHLEQCLLDMGLFGQIPILKLAISYPVDEKLVGRLFDGVDHVCVVEERRGFVEEQVGQIAVKRIQEGKSTPKIWGKSFPGGAVGLPSTGGLNSAICVEKMSELMERLEDPRVHEEISKRNIQIQLNVIADSANVEGRIPVRTPTFCPGCPHRDSAVSFLDIRRRLADPEYMKKVHGRKPIDVVFHGDTGCYTMLLFPPNEPLMHNYSGMGLGGATGAGIDPFITNKQVVFMGDGTFFHSGTSAISNSIKLGQDITYVILQNDTTAMTGHQPHSGLAEDLLGNRTFAQDIEKILRGMASTPGESQASHCSISRMNPEDRGRYDQLLEQTILADGVKIVIADKECGITHHRRVRRERQAELSKRGFLAETVHMNITPEVCEYCLECTKQTGCPGLTVEQTDHGPKMATDLSWCVNDGACARIDACPSFEEVSILRKNPPKPRGVRMQLDDLPEPKIAAVQPVWRAYLAGVGGMGISLATEVLVRAGHRHGYRVLFADKKGLAIRNGGVYSQVVFCTEEAGAVSQIVPYGKADLLLGVDILEAARACDPEGNIRVASPDRTATVVNTDTTPTILSLMGRDHFGADELEAILRSRTADGRFFGHRIKTLCERLFGTKLYANITMLGVAFQLGLIPLTSEEIEFAIGEGVRGDFKQNVRAFNLGRKLVVDPDLFDERREPQTLARTVREKATFLTLRKIGRRALRRLRIGPKTDPRWRLRDTTLSRQYKMLVFTTLRACRELDKDARRDVAIRIYELIQYGGIEYARSYAQLVTKVFLAEGAEDNQDGRYPVTHSVAKNLAKLMSIKDEFYVAHLLTSYEKQRRDRQRYNVNPSNGDRIRYSRSFHPRIFGRKMTIHIPHWSLYVLRDLRFIRNYLPFFHADDHRFLEWYRSIVERFCQTEFPTDAQTLDAFLQAIREVDAVNGFREHRTPKMDEARRRAEQRLRSIGGGGVFADILAVSQAEAAAPGR
jgi:indolepyruvate ferredoxin oxidoreductase